MIAMELSNINLEKAAAILKTVAHPLRLKVIGLLEGGKEMSVTELCRETGCEQSLTSHHLNAMKLRGLIRSRRDGKQILYSLKEQELLSLLGCLQKCNCQFE